MLFSEKFDTKTIYSEFGLSPNLRTVLFFAGGEFGLGRNTTFMTLKAIIRLFKDTQVVAISGKNHKMNEKFKTLIETTASSDRVKLLEFSDIAEKEIITIITGKDANPEEIAAVKAHIASAYPHVEVDEITGDQDIYSYIFSIE